MGADGGELERTRTSELLLAAGYIGFSLFHCPQRRTSALTREIASLTAGVEVGALILFVNGQTRRQRYCSHYGYHEPQIGYALGLSFRRSRRSLPSPRPPFWLWARNSNTEYP